MNAFPGVKEYFAQISKKVLEDGYVTFNEVTKRKNFIDFHEEFKRVERKVHVMDWKAYREHKQNQTIEFKTDYEPTVKKYFKWKGMIERRSYNFPVQGSGADMTKYASLMIFNYIMKKGYFNIVKIVNVVHDEILVESPEHLTEEMSVVVKDCMVKAGAKFFQRVPLDASCDVGKYWIH